MNKVKKIVLLSWVRQQAQDEIYILKGLPYLDTEFFNDEEFEHYIRILIARHKDDWVVIKDKKTENNE